MFVYLDNASTTKPYESVVQRMNQILLRNFGNPSSLHKLGIDAEKEIKNSRHIIANSIGAKDEEIIFTSGGTESDNTAISGIAHARQSQGNKIITTKVEHPAVLEQCKSLEKDGFKVEYLDVDSNCQVNLEQLKTLVDDNTILVTIMAVNNEIGTVFPIEQIGLFLSQKNKNKVIFHSDGIQRYGKMNFDVKNIDFLSISSHKIHGPKGVGALYVKKNLNFKPLILGGGQERNLRSGTENVQGIVGFAEAVREGYENLDDKMEQVGNVRNYLLDGILTEIKDVKVNGCNEKWSESKADKFLPTILNVSFDGIRGEVLLHTLEQDGIYVSTRSACSSSKNTESHVLKAMGLNNGEIEGAIRFSFSHFNSIDEMDYVIDKLKQGVNKMRALTNFDKRGK